MAAHRDPPPFDLGQTLKGTDADGNLINKEVLGKTWTFPSYSAAGTGPRQSRPKRFEGSVTVVALRNVSGITLYGKRLGSLKVSAGITSLTEVDGYGYVQAQDLVVFIDEFIATNGVAANDIFWGVIRGPVTVLTSPDGTAFNIDIAVGDRLIAGTAAASTGASTAGRVAGMTFFVGATAGITQNAIIGSRMIGHALSARTTGNTNADILVNAAISRIW